MEQRDTWGAGYIAWQGRAECRDVDDKVFSFVPEKETKKDLEIAQQWCSTCDVRTDCMLYALLYHEHGFWGGTSSEERTKLSARKDRKKCPIESCGSRNVITVDKEGFQLCVSCGLSWPTGSPPKPKLKLVPRNRETEEVIVVEGRL